MTLIVRAVLGMAHLAHVRGLRGGEAHGRGDEGGEERRWRAGR